MDGVGGAQHGVEQNYYKAVYYYDRLLEEARRIGAWPTLNSNEELQQAASAHPARDMCHIAQGLLEHCQNQIIQVSGPDAAHATARAPATMDTPRESTASLYNRLQTSRAASPSATTATASAPRSSLQTMLDLFADIDRARRQSQSTPFLRRLLNPFKARQAVSNAIKSGDGEIGEVEAKTSIDGARLQRDSRRVHWRYLDDFVGMLEGATNRPQ